MKRMKPSEQVQRDVDMMRRVRWVGAFLAVMNAGGAFALGKLGIDNTAEVCQGVGIATIAALAFVGERYFARMKRDVERDEKLIGWG